MQKTDIKAQPPKAPKECKHLAMGNPQLKNL
jgi:hypothetical protein